MGSSPTTPIAEFVRNERELAREQIGAAWQLHVERVQEELQNGWRANVASVVEERFAALEQTIDAEIERRVAERVEEGAAHARRKMSERLNQVARRLEQADDINAWTAAVLDGVQCFAPRALLFSVLGGSLKFEGQRSGTPSPDPAPDLRVPLASAPAFQGVADTLDTVIAVAAPGEVSTEIAAFAALSPEKRVCLLPVITGRTAREPKLAGVILAEPGDVPCDVNSLELLASLAGATLECRFHGAARPPVSSSLLGIASAPALPEASAEQAQEQFEMAAKAQRFARVRVAEMRLHHAAAVKRGREQRSIYKELQSEIDSAREAYRTVFMANGQADYLHAEFVRTLANGDPALLGDGYPGALV